MRLVKEDNAAHWMVEVNRPGAFKVVDHTGEYVGTVVLSLKMREPEPMPEGFDVETERRRMRQGGCCGGSTE